LRGPDTQTSDSQGLTKPRRSGNAGTAAYSDDAAMETGLSTQSEMLLRLVSAVLVFSAMALWEWRRPRRKLAAGRTRWAGNLGILLVDILAVRLLVPTAAVGIALLAAEHGWGVLHLLHVPFWPAAVVSVIALDLVIYVQHVGFHHVPWLWRVHRMHHADVEIDVTTGLRFHPIEILLSLAIKMGAVLALGAPAAAVVVFEVLLNATAMFNHSNVRLPPRLDRVVRLFIVTPQMHEVHHSAERRETDSNFGFNLPWWDRLFGTYREKPRAGETVVIGLPAFRDEAERSLLRMLTQPLRRES
jgi:sterol desaturase/sphingolipid hydroxylase (fatty acid hydroxylase superfamily)